MPNTQQPSTFPGGHNLPVSSRVVRVGILGFGTVGSGAYRMLQDNKEAITGKIGLGIEVVKIGIRDESKERSLPTSLFTHLDLQSIVDDPVDRCDS